MNPNFQKVLFVFLTLFSSFSFAGAFESSKHLVRQEDYWGDYRSKKIADKILPASAEMIDYLNKDNLKNGWPNKPRAAELSDSFRKDILDALSEIPKDLLQKINERLAGIRFVEDLGGSGYTEYVLNKAGHPTSGFIILDISVLNTNANEWATWKERSPFTANTRLSLSAEIESSQTNNRKNAVQYILLHEFGHILSIGSKSVIPWNLSNEQMNFLSPYSFSALSWKIENKKLVPVFERQKFDRKGLNYYGPEDQRLPAKDASLLYRQLEDTNFPTLYAATNPFDDFAESFASYVHVILLKRPWAITIVTANQKQSIYHPCWNETRCEEKQRLLEQILAN